MNICDRTAIPIATGTTISLHKGTAIPTQACVVRSGMSFPIRQRIISRMVKENRNNSLEIGELKKLRPGNTGFFVPEILASVAGVFFESAPRVRHRKFRHKKRALQIA